MGSRFTYRLDHFELPISDSGLRLLMLCFLCSLASWAAAGAPLTAPQNRVAYSHSGQFVVRSARSTGSFLNLTNRNFVQLEPALVAVSCERIKQILLRELEAPAPWRGKIYVTLYSARTANDPIAIASEWFRDGWQYQLGLPNNVERTRYVAAVTQALLLEMANRNGGGRPAEIPTWLVEGFTQELLASSGTQVILARPETAANGLTISSTFLDAQKDNPLERTHKELTSHAPLTFEQLSWPTEGQLGGEASALYRASAQLFVHQLLRLTNGPACMRDMLAQLPRFYNWQFAFLRAFHGHFQRPLEVEKWWALQLAYFTGRELAQTWTPEESWRKLDELLDAPVQIRTGTNELPLRTSVTLQTIVKEWNPAPQAQILQSKTYELQMLRLRLAPELASLVDSYRQALEAFLLNRDNTGLVLPFRKAAVLRNLKDETVRNLNLLDARRRALRPVGKSAPPMQAKADPGVRR